MPVDHGFNIRATSTYVTDDSDETYDLGAAYPVTRDGFTFGWAGDLTGNARDRSTTPDHRLAGFVQVESGSTTSWRLDIAAADYEIHIGEGDQTFGANSIFFKIADDTTVLATVDRSSSLAAADYMDAVGSTYVYTSWPGSEAGYTDTWASTILRIYCGQASPARDSKLCHVRLIEQAAGGTTIPVFDHHYRMQRAG